jgi:DNA polymerase III gamma/tau subunit
MIIKLNPVRESYLRGLMCKVIQAEQIQLEEEAIPYIMSLSNYSVRTVLNYLERYKILNIPITKEYIQQTHTDIHTKQFETFTNYIKNRQTKEAMHCIVQLYKDGYSIMDILDAYYVFIKKTNMEEEYKYKIIKIICKYTVVFNNIHEHHIELLFFVNDCINISNESRI